MQGLAQNRGLPQSCGWAGVQRVPAVNEEASSPQMAVRQKASTFCGTIKASVNNVVAQSQVSSFFFWAEFMCWFAFLENERPENAAILVHFTLVNTCQSILGLVWGRWTPKPARPGPPAHTGVWHAWLPFFVKGGGTKITKC